MPQNRLIRHHLVDRLFHWLLAISIFILLFTGLLPQFDVDFNWVELHWITGIVLTVLVAIHSVRSVFWKKLISIWFTRQDFSLAKGGKYSLEQKLMHNFITVLTLAVIVTGILMMVRLDTPFWERDPYRLEAETWGYIYVIHGLLALIFVSTIMLHIYFSLRPEKRQYLRAMIKGWISREEYLDAHDPELWQGEFTAENDKNTSDQI
ncbi:MAG: cytochrome b/b6 domain-containing protein [Gammaproteobacteria bacterium]|nr:cytochrome b/b6 domain-containing protein [Gammaproteobacteria bacterium]